MNTTSLLSIISETLKTIDISTLNALIDNLDEGVVLMDPEYNILAINTAFLKIYGLIDITPRKVISSKCYSVLRNRKMPCNDIRCPVQEVIDNFSLRVIEQKRIINNVEKKIVQVAIPIFDEKMNIKFILKIVKDLTCREDILLHKIHVFIQNLIENLTVPCVLISRSGFIKLCNKPVQDLLGYNNQEIINKRLADLFLPEVGLIWLSNLEKFLGKDVITDLEVTLVDKSGKLIFSSVTLLPVRVADSEDILIILYPSRRVASSIFGEFLRYNLMIGGSYLLIEEDQDFLRYLMKEFINNDFKVIMVTRSKEEYTLSEVRYIVLSDIEFSDKWMKTLIKTLKSSILKSKGPVLTIINDLYYLKMKSKSFKDVLSFVATLKDFIRLTKKGILLVSVNTSELEVHEINSLKRELVQLNSKMEMMTFLSDPSLCSILQCISKILKEKQSVYQKRLCEKMNISKVTMREKLLKLEEYKLIKCFRNGRMKMIELTEKGEYFLKKLSRIE